jgi:hypothetical protein
MSVLPDRALLRAVAEIIVGEEKNRAAALGEVTAELVRLKELIDEYGNVIRQPGPAGERGLDGAAGRDGIDGKDGAPGLSGEPGQGGQPGPQGEPGPPGLPGEAGPAGPPGDRGERGEAAYTGRALGRWNAEMQYRAMDVVAHNGSEWRAIVDDPGPLPGDGWMLSAKGVKGDKGIPGESIKGDRGERGLPGVAGPAGRGIADILIDNGVLVFVLTDGVRKEFMLEAAA